MLVLSRKKNQSIVIDGGIEIQVLQLKGGTVKLGINAPGNVRIVRGELDLFSDMVAAEEPSERPSANQVGENRIAYYVDEREELFDQQEGRMMAK